MKRVMRLDSCRWLHAAAVCWLPLLAAGGCAASRLLESPAEAELPLDPPAHGYPTAIRASLSDDADQRPATPEGSQSPAKEAAIASPSEPAHAPSSQQLAPVVQARREGPPGL